MLFTVDLLYPPPLENGIGIVFYQERVFPPEEAGRRDNHALGPAKMLYLKNLNYIQSKEIRKFKTCKKFMSSTDENYVSLLTFASNLLIF